MGDIQRWRKEGVPRMLGHRRERRRKLKAGAIVGKDVQSGVLTTRSQMVIIQELSKIGG